MGEQYKWNPSSERMGQMIRQAVYMEDQVTLEHLVKQKADLESVDETGATPLHIASTQCKPHTVKWLISRRADLCAMDQHGFSALTWACVKGHRTVVTELLAGRAPPDEPLMWWRDKGQALTASSGKTPLSLTCERGHLDCVEELLLRGAHIDSKNRDGTTPLMSAAHHAETEIVSFLLNRNVPVNSVDAEGWTPLMYSVNAPLPGLGEAGEQRVLLDGAVGRKSTTELLLLHKADCNAETPDGLTPLAIAAGQDRPQAVKRLLEGRASCNAVTAKGQSPLLLAAGADLPNVVRALIMAAAEVNQVSGKGESALLIAEKYGYKEVVDLLKKSGATAPKGKKKKKGKKK